ncbi:MAG: SdpI family protein [Oscillospiraceae bacterium]
MTKNKGLWVIWLLALLPLGLVAAVYSRLPAEIPMHWGFDGSVRYDPKSSIWLMVGLGPLFALLLPLLPKIDPRRNSYDKFMGAYQGFIAVMMLFLLVMNLAVLSEGFYPGRLDISTLVTVCMGLLFVFIGNIMPKFKTNFFCGFKNPWTLSNTEVWNRTHRLGGYLFFFGGFLIVLLPFLLPEGVMAVVFFSLLMAISIFPSVMSFVWYRRIEGAKPK